MSRIRSIKPEWLDDELMASAPDAARVLSIALICLADDYGNGRAGRAMLAGRVFPGRPLETIDGALHELVAMRYVLLYEVDGQRYFSIRTWDKHQRVDRPGLPKVPRPNLANAEDDSGNDHPDKSQEFHAEPQEKPELAPGSRASLFPSGSDVCSSVVALSDQPEKSGSARARRKPGAKSEHVPFVMHDGWDPPAEFVGALAEEFSVKPERVSATNAEFRYFWKKRGDRRKQAGWERTYRSNIERMAKSGALYAEPGAVPPPPQSGSRYQPQGDDAEARRSRRNNLIADAEAGRHGAEMQRWARSGKKLAELADRLENAPAPNVARVAAPIGRTLP